MMTRGEMMTHASVDGKAITFDDDSPNVKRHHPVTIDAREVGNSMPAGLRTEWVDGENSIHSVSLTCGAGLGSQWMTLVVRSVETDEIIYEGVISAGELVEAWVAAALEDDR